jgi:hypothetical protein
LGFNTLEEKKRQEEVVQEEYRNLFLSIPTLARPKRRRFHWKTATLSWHSFYGCSTGYLQPLVS